ncbi:MAG: O-acetyl-ADP-ribose deacetylase [Chitinophagaceae bacterium]|nr:O-acetyl-ADP-ribose deacetylase [Chitinophagaceae bacterium]
MSHIDNLIRGRIEVIKGDITELEVDAIVNAANSSLMGGGGVDGAIHRRGGPAILEECKEIISRIGRCEPGEAVLTGGGYLPASHVIHTVGPVWQHGKHNETVTLMNCYRNSLRLAVQEGFETIAFPNISTGVYNYPKDEAAAVAVNTTIDFLLENTFPKKVIFCCFDLMNYNWTEFYLQNYLKQETGEA